MKLKIISDGTPMGTQILSETGEVIENVIKVSWEAEIGEIPRAKITVLVPRVELVADAEQEKTL